MFNWIVREGILLTLQWQCLVDVLLIQESLCFWLRGLCTLDFRDDRIMMRGVAGMAGGPQK